MIGHGSDWWGWLVAEDLHFIVPASLELIVAVQALESIFHRARLLQLLHIFIPRRFVDGCAAVDCQGLFAKVLHAHANHIKGLIVTIR